MPARQAYGGSVAYYRHVAGETTNQTDYPSESVAGNKTVASFSLWPLWQNELCGKKPKKTGKAIGFCISYWAVRPTRRETAG